MAFIPKTFATDEIAKDSADKVPAGWYTAKIVESALQPTSSGGQMLVLDFVIQSGQHQGAKLVDRLNIVNSNETAERIAYQTLGNICKALGMSTTPTDSAHLHNKPIDIQVSLEESSWKDKQTGETKTGTKNEIKKYRAPQQGQSAAPAAASAGSSKPWGR